MSRKDYRAFAEIIKDARADVAGTPGEEAALTALHRVSVMAADYFKADNVNFNRDRFMDACIPAPTPKAPNLGGAMVALKAPAWARKVTVKLRSSMDTVKG